MLLLFHAIRQEMYINPLNAELNLICPFLVLFGAHHILHISRQRANSNSFPENLLHIADIYLNIHRIIKDLQK